MNLNVCKKICNECPFSNKSLNGWLAEYTVEDIVQMQSQEILFPCHMMMKSGNMELAEVQEAIENGELKLCRGYVESIIKSAKMPKFNKMLIEARANVKSEGISEESMSIWVFKKHHEALINNK